MTQKIQPGKRGNRADFDPKSGTWTREQRKPASPSESTAPTGGHDARSTGGNGSGKISGQILCSTGGHAIKRDRFFAPFHRWTAGGKTGSLVGGSRQGVHQYLGDPGPLDQWTRQGTAHGDYPNLG